MPTVTRLHHWEISPAVPPAALVPVAQFVVPPWHSRDQLFAQLAHGPNRPYSEIEPQWRQAFSSSVITICPPTTPTAMMLFGLDQPPPRWPPPKDILRAAMRGSGRVDPAVLLEWNRENEQRRQEYVHQYQVEADAVVKTIHQLGLQPGTYDDLLALVGSHDLTPQPGLPGWQGGLVTINALGSCEQYEESDAPWQTGFQHPYLSMDRRIIVGRPFTYLLLRWSGDEAAGRGKMLFGQSFVLAVQR